MFLTRPTQEHHSRPRHREMLEWKESDWNGKREVKERRWRLQKWWFVSHRKLATKLWGTTTGPMCFLLITLSELTFTHWTHRGFFLVTKLVCYWVKATFDHGSYKKNVFLDSLSPGIIALCRQKSPPSFSFSPIYGACKHRDVWQVIITWENPLNVYLVLLALAFYSVIVIGILKINKYKK